MRYRGRAALQRRDNRTMLNAALAAEALKGRGFSRAAKNQ
jgi:hypothetical protein